MTIAAFAARGALRRGAKGEAVAALQAALRRTVIEIVVDGDFGPVTRDAVKAFQVAHGLLVDGIGGKRTATVLDALDASRPHPNPPPQAGEGLRNLTAPARS